MKSLVSLVLSLTLAITVPAAAADQARYGEVVTYRENEPIPYPDFTLIYKGQILAWMTQPNTPVMAHVAFERFTVSSKAGDQEISWSGRTGPMAETKFLVGDHTFYLDLAPRKNGKFLNSGTRDLIIHDAETDKANRQ